MNRFRDKAILRDTYYLSACVVRDYMRSATKATRQSIIKAYFKKPQTQRNLLRASTVFWCDLTSNF